MVNFNKKDKEALKKHVVDNQKVLRSNLHLNEDNEQSQEERYSYITDFLNNLGLKNGNEYVLCAAQIISDALNLGNKLEVKKPAKAITTIEEEINALMEAAAIVQGERV